MEWLLFLAQLPASPSSLRVMTWRKMKSAGAVGLQNGVWLLPRSDEHEHFLQELLETIRGQAASGQVFVVAALDEAVQSDILERFRRQSDEEYTEFIERCAGFLEEIDKETGLAKFTFAELEENEQDLQKLERWLVKIQARNFGGGSRAQEAAQQLAACRAAFETFTRRVYNREGMGS